MNPPGIEQDLWRELTALRAEVTIARAEVATARADIATLKVEMAAVKELLAEVNKEVKLLTRISNRVTGGAIMVMFLGGLIGGIATLGNFILGGIRMWFKGG